MCFISCPNTVVASTEPKQVYGCKQGFVSERTIKDIIIIPRMRAGSSSGTFHSSQSGEKGSTSTTPPKGAARRGRVPGAL